MKTREIRKNISILMYKVLFYDSFFEEIECNYEYTKNRDVKGRFFYLYSLTLNINGEYIGKISDIYSRDITFEKLKPKIKKILGEHFGFWWKVRNLFR